MSKKTLNYDFEIIESLPNVLKDYKILALHFPASAIFQYPLWMNFKKNLILVQLKFNGVLVAYALVEKKRLIYDIVFGPIISDFEMYNFFFQELFKYAQKNNAYFLRITPCFERCYKIQLRDIFKTLNYNTIELDTYKTLLTNLQESEEFLYQKIATHHKNAIKKSKKLGLSFVKTENIDLFLIHYNKFSYSYDLNLSPIHRTRYIRSLYNCFNEQQMANLFFVQKRDEILGGLLFLNYNNNVYYAYGFSNKKAKIPILHFGFWESIKYFKKLNYCTLDWGGFDFPKGNLRLDNIHLFKKRFGGTIFEYQQTIVVELKWLKYRWFWMLKKLYDKIIINCLRILKKFNP